MPEDAHVTTPHDREGIIRLATELIRIAKVDVRSDVSEVCIRVEGWWREFNPFENIADAHELESAIPEAKRSTYVNALFDVVGADSMLCDGGMWVMVHATPRQRSQAALAVLEKR